MSFIGAMIQMTVISQRPRTSFVAAGPCEYAPVELGDVGYFHEGAFVKLFNASKDIHSWSNRLGLPEGHTSLQVGDIVCKTPLPKALDISQAKAFLKRLLI